MREAKDDGQQTIDRIAARLMELERECEAFKATAGQRAEDRLQAVREQLQLEIALTLRSFEQRMADLRGLLEDGEQKTEDGGRA